MTQVFVYPRIDLWYKNRNMMREANQLGICNSGSDPRFYFGVREAIESFCEQHGSDIAKIEWYVYVDPDWSECEVIKAKNLDDWEKKYNALRVSPNLKKDSFY